jgi:tripartite-type tricarboxylate transporter receptor subunit TctC
MILSKRSRSGGIALKSLFRALCALAACLTATFAPAQQNWPTRPIRLIVPTGPGLGTDIMARLMADGVSRGLGAAMVVENIAGAGGVLGAQAAARAEPDGYTFFFANGSALTSNKYMLANLRYDPDNDFDAVAILTTGAPFVFAADPKQPFSNVPELVAYAKAHPGKLSYGVDTSSGLGLVAARAFVKRAGVDIVEVAYRSTPQMVQDTAAGRIPLMVSAMGPVVSFLTDGTLKPVAMSSESRFPTFPNVQAIAETIPGFNVDGWLTVVAPARTPLDIRARVGDEITKFIQLPDIRQRMVTNGLVVAPPGGTPQSAAAYIRREQARWKEIAAELALAPQ